MDNPSFREAFTLYQAGEYVAARDVFDAYMAAHENDWRAGLWHARTVAELGDTRDAMALLAVVARNHPGKAAVRAFEALVLFDAGRYGEAEQAGEKACRRGKNVLAHGICLLARVRKGCPPMREMFRVLAAGNAELRGRALHVAEERLHSLPRDVRRDVMDEVGIGWPGYAFLPPWLFKRSHGERTIWRQLARGSIDDAMAIVSTWASHPEDLSRGKLEAMIATAMMADAWESASTWALNLDSYRRYATSATIEKGPAVFQLAVFHGICLLLTGSPGEALHELEIARERDSTSYLPAYLSARAHVKLGNLRPARRCFVAACDSLNPSLALQRWEELIEGGQES